MATPLAESYRILNRNQGYRYKDLQKVFRSYGENRETEMFGGTSLPNLLSLTSQRTN